MTSTQKTQIERELEQCTNGTPLLHPDYTLLVEGEPLINIDEAVDELFERWNWPQLGGPSGRGWSHFGVAQRCGRLFQWTHDAEAVTGGLAPEIGKTPIKGIPLQVGGLYHTLQALSYGHHIEDPVVVPNRGGIVAGALYKAPGRRVRWRPPVDAAAQLIAGLHEMVNERPDRAPDLGVILEAKRLHDVHENRWDHGGEDVTPLAVEYWAKHSSGYTVRYDMIGRVGKNDPLQAPGVYIYEKKTAAWLDEQLLEGWVMDGEILGELLAWDTSGCKEQFGPLAGIVIDMISKAKTPQTRRVSLPPPTPGSIMEGLVENHARWILNTDSDIRRWRAFNVYPQSFGNCHGKYGRCSAWQLCSTNIVPITKKKVG